MLIVCFIWAFGISPRVIDALGVVPATVINIIVGGIIGAIGYKVKAWLDAEDARFRRYEKKLVNKMHDIITY